jgi:hypothetical protein
MTVKSGVFITVELLVLACGAYFSSFLFASTRWSGEFNWVPIESSLACGAAASSFLLGLSMLVSYSFAGLATSHAANGTQPRSGLDKLAHRIYRGFAANARDERAIFLAIARTSIIATAGICGSIALFFAIDV